MDILAAIEPQLALPVIGVVVFAVLVYIFGFQQTQEPSYQHLAVLQSSGKSSKSTQNKPKSATANGSAGGAKATTKAKDKSATNGHAHPVQGKDKATKADKVTNKENVKPQVQTPATTPKAAGSKKEKKIVEKPAEDLEGGDWIQAPSRKDKNKPKPTKTQDAPISKSPKAGKPQRIEDVISEMNKNKGKLELDSSNSDSDSNVLQEKDFQNNKVEVQVDVHENKSSSPSSVESTPKKAKDKKKKVAPAPVIQVEKPKEPEKVEVKAPEPVPEPVVAPVKGKKGAAAAEPEFAKNVAFDELGGGSDAWEEAKSRGAKKKRARKD